MVNFSSALVAIAIAATAVTAMPAAAPAPTAAPSLKDAAVKRGSSTACTFTDAAAASKSKASCATIVLDNIAVPSGTTLDMTKLTEGTHL